MASLFWNSVVNTYDPVLNVEDDGIQQKKSVVNHIVVDSNSAFEDVVGGFFICIKHSVF